MFALKKKTRRSKKTLKMKQFLAKNSCGRSISEQKIYFILKLDQKFLKQKIFQMFNKQNSASNRLGTKIS